MADEPADRRRERSWKLAVGAATLLAALVLGFYMLQASAQGEYLGPPTFGPLSGATLVLVKGIPYVDPDRATYGLAPAYYLNSGGTIRLSTGERFAPSRAAPYYYTETSGAFSSGSEPIIERVPLGALDELVEAMGNRDIEGMRDAAERLEAALPERTTTKYLRIATLIVAGELDEARRLIAVWEPDFRADPTYRGEWYLELLANDLLAAEPDQVELRAWIASAFPLERSAQSSPYAGFDGLMHWFVERREISTPRRYSLGDITRPPYYLDFQIAWKMGITRARMLAFGGQFDRAHALLLGLYRCQEYGRGYSTLLEVSLSATLKTNVLDAMRDIYLHGTQSADRLERVWSDLASIDSAMDPVAWDADVTVLRAAPWLNGLGPGRSAFHLGSYLYPWGNEVIRCKVAEAQRELLRAGLRARHYRLVHGEWPASGAEGVLAGPPTIDPFDPAGVELRTARTGDALTLYSVGPDAVDDGATFVYDSASGAGSGGDIVLELRAEPRYDYPADAGHVYSDEAEFAARYLSGLPKDLFSNGGRSPLQLATDGTGRVWSYGPDADQSGGDHTVPGVPEALHYDPTNGTTSDGDLWLELHFAAPPGSAR